MGVHGLWPVLDEICERKPLTYLTGQRVAIDLSGWVVQAVQCKGLNISKTPHLRNLFFRVSCLLQLGIHPIFVMEGIPPSLKEATIKERNLSRYPESNSTCNSRQTFDKVLKQCQDLLACLGVPCIKSSGEAEALCAFLYLKGIVDGVITEDNDAFLYGADVVYRDFTIAPTDSHVDVYCLKSEKNRFQLSREKFVALALLLGCDYCKGVPSVGKETALKLLSRLDCNILQRFKDWKRLNESELFPGLENNVKKSSHCNRCGHIGSFVQHKRNGCSACDSAITCYLIDDTKPCKCFWHVNDELQQKWKIELKVYKIVKECSDFPNLKVIEEYLHYTDNIPCDEDLKWSCPNLLNFQEIALDYMNWTFEYSHKKVFPLITFWQLQNYDINKEKFIYEPVKILKQKKIKGIKNYEVQWKLLGCDNDISEDNLITCEPCVRFAACYEKIVDNFHFELKAEKQTQVKGKKLKSNVENQKVKLEPDIQTIMLSPRNSPHNLENKIQKILAPKSPTFEDSFDGLLDVPLWERIKIIPKMLYKHSSPVLKSFSETCDDSFSFSFDEKVDFHNLFSPVTSKYSVVGLKFINENKLKDNLGSSYDNLNSVINVEDNTTTRLPLNFNDTGDSFLNILLSQNKNSDLIDIPEQQFVHIEQQLNINSSSTEPKVNFSNQKINNECLHHIQNVLSPVTKILDSNSCFLYSAHKSPYNDKKGLCLNPFLSDTFYKNTPVTKQSMLSKISLDSHELTKPLSNLVFTSLNFDSSTDDISIS